MFTLILPRQMAREELMNWWYLGFLPSQDVNPGKRGSLSSKEKLQQYHNYMSVFLEEVKKLQR
jgi:hypothetical protein